MSTSGNYERAVQWLQDLPAGNGLDLAREVVLAQESPWQRMNRQFRSREYPAIATWLLDLDPDAADLLFAWAENTTPRNAIRVLVQLQALCAENRTDPDIDRPLDETDMQSAIATIEGKGATRGH